MNAHSHGQWVVEKDVCLVIEGDRVLVYVQFCENLPRKIYSLCICLLILTKSLLNLFVLQRAS